MDSTPIDQEDGFASDIIGTQKYEAERPKKKDFLPWHHPRKQFVRQKQWCDQINRMIKDLLPENGVLKYLGLPGEDLLDLRYFHQNICVPNNLKLRFLGFNFGANSKSANSTELNISLDEVNRLEFVDPSSIIIGDNICQIANENSIAWERSRRMGPYDIINLDLCDGIGKHSRNEFEKNHYDTLSQLMALQSRRAQPWLLFLTTRTGKEHINDEVFSILKSIYIKNLDTCQDFLNASIEHYIVSDNDTLDKISSTSKGMSDIFLISLCKWIASINLTQNPPAKFELKSVLGYVVDPRLGHQDLISLAIKIEPTFFPSFDPMGLARSSYEPINECNIAVKALKGIFKQKDVDSILQSNTVLMDEMAKTTSDLLEEARYDISGYKSWVNDSQKDS